MWTSWVPWRFLVSRAARSAGFVDPVPLLDQLEHLAQPSEVVAPLELLRAGALFHARGLVNARVLQSNLGWVWPYWVERQYDPEGDSFVPRAFSLTHVNLTHRNWTAVGIPDVDRHPIVDPRGLVTPCHDGWSVDGWLLPEQGEPLLPSRTEAVEQRLLFGSADGAASEPEARPARPTSAVTRRPDRDAPPGLAVETHLRGEMGRLVERVRAGLEDDGPFLRIDLRAEGEGPGWLALSLRPSNPEGVSFIHRLERTAPAELEVNQTSVVRLDRPPDRVFMSRYHRGDVFHDVRPGENAELGRREPAERDAVECRAGLATAAALYRLDEHGEAHVSARIALAPGSRTEPGATVRVAGTSRREPTAADAWRTVLDGTARLQTPEEHFGFLYDAAVRSLVLLSPGDVYPGPYTYKRFWFRDAAFIVDALCSVGLTRRARRAVERFPERQERSGYFRSQEGEWDSNGAALWAMDRYRRLAGKELPTRCVEAARKGARWVEEKRLDPELDEPHAGLLPAGFSAEHLGPNDYFFWDDFWCAAGLRAAARIVRADGADGEAAARFEEEADDLLAAVDRSIEASPGHRQAGGVPASPYRPLDAGAVGSLCAGYPLRLWSPDDRRLLATVEHLLEHHTVKGGFFQDMIHSGINPYLTLHLARVLLRAGDPRQEKLVRTVAGLASSTGQWPEAVHPRTGGGCMGDGQHLWAASEWALAMRSWFVREEEPGRLILASGIPGGWLRGGETSAFGPTPTPYGPVTVRVRETDEGAVVEWAAEWRGEPPRLDVRLPGYRPETPHPDDGRVQLVARGPAP